MSTTPFPDEITVWRGPVDRYGRPIPPPPTWVGGTSPPPVDPGEPEPPVAWDGPADPLPAPDLPIDRDTPWRSTLDCGVAPWLEEADRLGSPMDSTEIAAVYQVVQPWAAQCLADGIKETELGATARGAHNFLNIFDSGGTYPVDFPSWEACAQSWWDRFTDDGYKGGVYMPRAMSVEQKTATYQGGPGCWQSRGQTCANGETWQPCAGGSASSNSVELSIQQTVARVNTFMGHPQTVPWQPVPGGAGCAEPEPEPPGGSAPPIYTLPQDAARFGISTSCANYIVGNNFPNRSGRPVQRIVLHTQEGTTPGSLGWWCSQGVQASSTIMAQKDGSLLYIVPEKHGPWTNGDTCAPSGDGVQAVTECAQNPNCCSLTVETEGYFGETHPQRQIDAIAWQCQQWMAKYGLACADVLAHRDYNSCSRANCSGADIYNRVMTALGCPERY